MTRHEFGQRYSSALPLVEIDWRSRHITWNENNSRRQLELTSFHLALFEILYHAAEYLKHSDLQRLMWAATRRPSTHNAIRTQICRLRRDIQHTGFFIIYSPGRGYTLRHREQGQKG